MTTALAHRGPDASGTYIDECVGLGFRRLAVIDLETGNQPIVLEDGDDRWAIALNGEIYNYRELRRALEGRGIGFRTTGDVEVAMRLLVADGIGAVARLNGMFAFALWHRGERKLFLGRDRHGIKPLYFCRQGGSVAFASEIGALAAGGWPADPRPDGAEIHHFLTYGWMSPTGSPLHGVKQVAPATVLEIRADGREQVHEYWRSPDPEERGPSLPRATAELAAALDGAIRRQLVADVPVGVFLSGGVDSSALVALAASVGQRPLRTFSVGFEEPGVVSELAPARRVAQHFGSEHHELLMRSTEVARDLERLLDDLDAPLADPTAIPTWYMARLARETVTVALSGEGADELFGGYARQRYDVLLDRLGWVGRWVAPAVLTASGRPPSPRLATRLLMPSSLGRQLDWGRLFQASEIDRLSVRANDEAVLEGLLSRHAKRWADLARKDPVNARLEADRTLFLPGDLLPKVDRMSMAHSLEVRVPYLDDEVVDLVLPWPGRLKVGLWRDKVALRQCARGLLPARVAGRRKQGFDVPFGRWLRGALREPASDLLDRARLDRFGLLVGGVVQTVLDEHLAGRADRGRDLFALLVLERWWEGLRHNREG